jgi:chaperonin GroEL
MSRVPIFEKELDKLVRGLEITVKAAAGTLGPKGRNVFFPKPPFFAVTNDGKTIVDAIDLEDDAEKEGSWLVKNTCAQQVDDAGDGSTTAAVLLQAIVQEARKRPENSTEVAQSLKLALPSVLKAIKARSKPVKDIHQVALISAEDPVLASKIAEVVDKVGDKGTILVEENNEPKIDYEIVNGYEAHVGYMSPYFATDTKKMTAEMKDVAMFCTRRRISAISDLTPLIEQMNKKNIKQIVIVCEDIDPQMLGILVTSRLQGKISCVVVKATGPLLDDIAMATGASLLCDDTGITFENFQADDHLGLCQKFTCTEKKSVYISNAKSAKLQADRLEAWADSNPNTFEAKKYRERAAKLKSGIAILRIGSPTTVELGYLKDKADDAVRATQASLEEGIVAGGGTCLRDVARAIKGKTIGDDILRKALLSPYKQILANGGLDYAEHPNDTYDEGVIDPAKVTRCAVTNAVTNAAMLINLHCAIVDKPKEETK